MNEFYFEIFIVSNTYCNCHIVVVLVLQGGNRIANISQIPLDVVPQYILIYILCLSYLSLHSPDRKLCKCYFVYGN